MTTRIRSSLVRSTLLAALITTGLANSALADTPALATPAAAVVVTAPASAPQPTAIEPPHAYDLAIDRAVDEHERGHFEEAREHFREAHELYPNARTLRGLGKVEFELRNYGESAKFLQAALSEQTRPLGAELRAEVETLLERARAYVGEVHVAVQPGTATVSVDGVTGASGPEAALNPLVGDHVLEFRASGRLPERRQISVRGRDQINVQVVLTPPDNGAPASAAWLPVERRPEQTPTYKKWWVWTAVGVAVAGAATAVAVAAVRARSNDTRLSGGTSGVVIPNP
jgi:hypothetical protein